MAAVPAIFKIGQLFHSLENSTCFKTSEFLLNLLKCPKRNSEKNYWILAF